MPSEGLMPEAHPTAPGGMSQKALVTEMVERHGWDETEAKRMKWPAQMDAVAQGRLREDATRRLAEGLDVPVSLINSAVAEEDDIDALLAEMEQGKAEAEAEKAQAVLIAPPSLLIKDPHTLDYIFNGHAGAGPSASERWMHCTASLGASRAFLETLTPNQQRTFAVAGEAARQGTTAHAAAEVEANLLLGRIDQGEADFSLMELAIEPDTSGEAYDEEMAEYVTEYVDLVKQYAHDRGEEYIHIEARVEAAVPLTGSHDEEVYSIRGSADFIAMPTKDEPVLVVGDLKYGNGIDVDVDENSQVRIYGLGALDLLTDEEGNLITNVETVTYHIVQPRLGGIKTWSEPIEDLLDWRDERLAPALTAALYGKAEGAVFAPSETACQWCPVRGACHALAESRITEARELFDTITEAEFADGAGAFPETATLSGEKLGSLLSQVQGLVKISEDLKAEAQRRLHRGEQVPGYQLVSYTPPRSWSEEASSRLDPRLHHDEGAVPLSAEMREALWKAPTLVTPTQALAVLKKSKINGAVLDDIIDVPDKRPVIAPEGDRRKPWTGTPPEQMFADESGEEGVA